MKKVFAFLAMLSLLAMLGFGTVGCGEKDKDKDKTKEKKEEKKADEKKEAEKK